MKIETYLKLGFEEAAKREIFFNLCSEHIDHARKKHPLFAKEVNWRKPECFSFYAKYHKENIKDHGYTIEDVFLSECFEFLEALVNGDLNRAREEAADVFAVMYRALSHDKENTTNE